MNVRPRSIDEAGEFNIFGVEPVIERAAGGLVRKVAHRRLDGERRVAVQELFLEFRKALLLPAREVERLTAACKFLHEGGAQPARRARDKGI